MSEASQDVHKELAGKEGEVKSLEAQFQFLPFEGPVNIILMQMQHYPFDTFQTRAQIPFTL